MYCSFDNYWPFCLTENSRKITTERSGTPPAVSQPAQLNHPVVPTQEATLTVLPIGSDFDIQKLVYSHRSNRNEKKHRVTTGRYSS